MSTWTKCKSPRSSGRNVTLGTGTDEGAVSEVVFMRLAYRDAI
ncbi:hypothetical protein [Lysobacter gummosus]